MSTKALFALVPALLVWGQENPFEVEQIEDLNSHISIWEQDPYYAFIEESENLDEVICLAE